MSTISNWNLEGSNPHRPRMDNEDGERSRAIDALARPLISSEIAVGIPLILGENVFLDRSALAEIPIAEAAAAHPYSLRVDNLSRPSAPPARYVDTVDLTNMSLSKAGAIAHIRQYSGIKKIIFSKNLASQLTDADMRELLRRFPGIEELNISGAQLLTNRGFTYLAKLPRIRKLILKDSSIDGKGFDNLTIYAEHTLTHLDIERCHLIPRKSLGKLARRFSKLQYVNIAHCNQFTDRECASLTFCKTLKKIKMKGCVTLTGYCFKFWILPNLKTLDIRGCCSIVPSSVSRASFFDGLETLKADKLE